MACRAAAVAARGWGGWSPPAGSRFFAGLRGAFSGAVGAPTSFRACHRSIPPIDGLHDLRERNFAWPGVFRQSRPGRCVGLPRGRDHGLPGSRRGCPGVGRLVAARWLAFFLRVSVEPDVFSCYENLWPGGTPGPPNDIPRATSRPSDMVRPPEARPEPDGVAAARDHRVPSLRGDAEQPGGERVLRRLEAALDTLPGRIACLGATRGGGAGGAQTRPAPNPQQAFGLPGRSQPRPSEPCGPGRPGQRGARPSRAAASAVPPVRTSGAPGCASAPHVVFAGVCGHDPRRRRCANHR